MMHIGIQVEVVGCPTVCMHCWAQGVRYAAMPLDEIRYVLEALRGYCADQGHECSAFPMHEVAAHPEAPAVLALFRELVMQERFEPLATTGVPIALRDDWQAFLNAIGAVGTRTFWVAFHGYEETHDRLVNRAGAFRETCLAVERIKAAGFGCGANIFVTTESVRQYHALSQTLAGLGLNGQSWEPADFYPTPRGRHDEAQRPDLDDLAPLADEIGAIEGYWQHAWADLSAYTEAAHMKRALQGDWPAPWQDGSIHLVCRPNLDIHTGKAGVYGPRHGNLRTDDAADVLTKAIAEGSWSDDRLCYGTDALPEVAELARTAGDLNSKAIHFGAHSIRNLWLDRSLHRL